MGEGGGDDGGSGREKKPHRKPHAGRKAEKKEGKTKKIQENVDPRIRNPKAFAINSVVRAERKFRRTQDIETKKERVPIVDRSPVEPPPFVIAIVGPPKVGKTTLFMNLVKNYTRQNLSDIKGPVTIVSGKKRRLTFIECNNDINSMIDVAKVADLALLLVDASFGFEMEVFEFLNICQVHGFPQIMGVLTHLDLFRNKKKLKKTKKTLKHRFWTEVYPGAKLFYLSGYFPMTQTYPKNEVHNLARFISVMKFRSTTWKSEHAYVVADRMEDLTSLEAIRVDPKVDRRISLYGWVHGTFLKQHVSVHVPGLGDFTPDAITALPDPCPLPLKERALRRSLNEKEKIMYAPFSGVGGIVYDQDAVYIDLGGSHSHKARDKVTEDDTQEDTEKGTYVSELRDLKTTLDEKIKSAGLKLFSTSDAITGAEMTKEFSESEDEEDSNEVYEKEMSKNFDSVVADDGRVRRRVIFDDEKVSQAVENDESRVEEIDDDDDDDVVRSIQKELKELKKSGTEIDKADKLKLKAKNVEIDEDMEESDIESEDDEPVKKHEKKCIPSTPKDVECKKDNDLASQDVSSIVSKLKSKLSKTSSENEENDTSIQTCKARSVQENEDSDSESENSLDGDDDEDMGELEQEDDDDMEEEDSDNSDAESYDGEHESYNKTAEDESDNEAEAKDKRFSLAEEAFYSRFRNRSTQKMIYDDTEDYLNVTSKADFDVANCNVKERQEDIDDDTYMKSLFIGGDYAETAKKFLDAENEDSEDDVFGDFEELDDEGDERPKKSKKGDEDDPKTREEMKKQLKEKFDMEYDDGGADKSFYKEWKAQVEEQTKINRTFFDNVDDPNLLRDLQGLAPGTYVRVELSRIPFEFVTNFDPQRCCPLVVGSLDSPNQETLAVVQARVKKHRWHPKILKTRDPLILSVGWRRFQTVSLYSVQDHNMRNRMIKYTPEHLHCIANFYGPMTPQGTGILGIAPAGFEGFRIVLTGTILDMDKSTELVKKLKLVGTPAKIYKKSAFIEGMFTSQLEVAKFVGAKIKTVSGIRGVIKKELRNPPGAFRATFEDKIVASDIVFCRTWAKVDVPPFYLNIPTHVIAQPRLMKTMGQLKRERDVKVEPNPDHLYSAIERSEKRFRPLKIPKSLQEKLPFKDKPKVQAKLNAPKRIAVVKDPHERQMTKFIRTLKTKMSDRDSKEKAEKAKKASEREKVMKKLEEKQTQRQKELRKKVFRTLGLMNKQNEGAAPGTSSSSGRKGGGGGGKQFGNRLPKRRK